MPLGLELGLTPLRAQANGRSEMGSARSVLSLLSSVRRLFLQSLSLVLIVSTLSVIAPQSASAATVTAIGDGTNYANSSTSSLSELVTTIANRSQTTTLTPVFTLGITSQTYMVATTISATAAMSGKVAFSVAGRAVPGCTAVKTIANVATCSWKPSVMGAVTITAVFTPTDAGYAILTKNITIKVTPK